MKQNDTPPPVMNAAHKVPTPFGEIMVPLMLMSAQNGGAPLVAMLQLWAHAWPADFPGPLAATIALAAVKAEDAEIERMASLN